MNLSYMKSPKAILITGISLLSLVFATAGQSQVTVNGEVTYISQVSRNMMLTTPARYRSSGGLSESNRSG